MDVSPALEAHAEAAEVMEPGDRALDHPAIDAEATSVLVGPVREEGADPALPHLAAMGFGAVGPVSVDLLGASTRVAHLAPDRGDRVNQRDELRDVVAVAAREDRRQRDAAAVHEDVVLASGPAPVDGAGPGFFPPPPRP